MSPPTDPITSATSDASKATLGSSTEEPVHASQEREAKSNRKRLKVVVSRKKKRSAKSALPGRGMPRVLREGRQKADSPTTRESTTNAASTTSTTDFFGDDEINMDDFPCDTMLALRSLIRSNECLVCPLYVGEMVSCVLEPQLYKTLATMDGSDSVVTHELSQLVQSNTVRRLPCGDTMAVMETENYVRAVWDASQQYNSNGEITTWFTSSLSKWTGRTISQDELRQCWTNNRSKKRMMKHDISVVIDTLVNMQVLLPSTAGSSNNYSFWLPHWGQVLQSISEARNKALRQLKRSYHKELSQKQLESQRYPAYLSGRFVIANLVSEGVVEIRTTPSGPFVKLCKS